MRILMLLACSALLPGQNYVQKVVEIKNVDPQTVYQALYAESPTKDGYVARIRANRELGIISIYGLPADVEQIAANIAALDKPRTNPLQGRNLELRFHVIAASKGAGSAEGLPKEIGPAVSELRSSLGFSELRLLDTVLVRARQSSESRFEGVVPCLAGQSGELGCRYQLQMRTGGIRGTRSELGIDDLTFNAGLRQSAPGANVSMRTAFDIADGQSVVVGKTNFDGDGRSLILIVSAKAAN